MFMDEQALGKGGPCISQRSLRLRPNLTALKTDVQVINLRTNNKVAFRSRFPEGAIIDVSVISALFALCAVFRIPF
jgi:hypothetical protein